MKLCDCEIFCGIISEDPIFYLCACIQMWYYFNRTDLFVLLISSIPMFVFKINWIQLLVHDNTTSPRACLDIAAWNPDCVCHASSGWEKWLLPKGLFHCLAVFIGYTAHIVVMAVGYVTELDYASMQWLNSDIGHQFSGIQGGRFEQTPCDNTIGIFFNLFVFRNVY